MGFLSELEQRIESAVGRIFPRRRGECVQPAEIARAMVRAMEKEQRLSVGAVYVPNVFRVGLHPDDLESLLPVRRTIERDAKRYVAEVAEKRGFAFAGPLELHLDGDAQLAKGTLSVAASFREEEGPSDAAEPTRRVQGLREVERGAGTDVAAPGSAPAFDPDVSTQRYRLARDAGETLALEVVEGPDRGRWVALDTAYPLRIGRTAQCDLVLADPRVSKVHAVCRYEDGVWWIEDRGSTNGTHVNGRRVSREMISVDDEVTVGLSTLRLVRKERRA